MKILKTISFTKTADVDLVNLLLLLVAEDVKEIMATGTQIDEAIESAVSGYKAKAPQGGDAWEGLKPQLKQYVMMGGQVPSTDPQQEQMSPGQGFDIQTK